MTTIAAAGSPSDGRSAICKMYTDVQASGSIQVVLSWISTPGTMCCWASAIAEMITASLTARTDVSPDHRTRQAKKADRFKGGIENLGTGPLSSGQQGKEFDRIELAAKLFAPPPVKFKDLESFISDHKLLSGPVFPFDVRTDFVRVTDDTVLVPITLQIKNSDVTFTTKDGV